MKTDERILIEMHRNGDSKALGILLEQNKKFLFRVINNIVRNQMDAEDILHDVFLKAIIRINNDGYIDQGTLKAWLKTIAHNLSINFILKKSKITMVSLPPLETYQVPFGYISLDPEKIVIKKEDEHFLKILVNKLPKKQREVVVLRIYHDLKFREIEKTINRNSITIRTRMHVALNTLIKLANEIEPNSMYLD